jgi:hypothetical protein
MAVTIDGDTKVMKTISPTLQIRGFTVWDLLIVLVTVVVVAGFLLPVIASRGRRTSGTRIRCVNNLKQVGLGFRLWAYDHGEKFPMGTSTDKGGSLESVATGEVFRHYLVISNELNSPKVLACPNDKDRKPTPDFSTLSNGNVSYFVGLDAVETNPQLILSGDRNISTNGHVVSKMLTLDTNNPVSWTKDIHNRQGNLGLADGSAQQVSDSSFQNQVSSSLNLSQRLAIP